MKGIPVKALAILAACVILAHLLVLQGAARALQADARIITTRPFITRSIALNQPAPAAPATAPAPAAIAPKPVRQPPPPALPNVAATAQPATEPQPGTAVALAEPTPTAASDPAPPVAQAPATAASAAAADVAVAPQASPQDPSPANSEVIAYTVPGTVRLKYDVKGLKDNLNYSARAEMSWLQDGSNYEAQLEVSAFLIGARVRTSTGRLTPDGLAPTRFADKFRTEVAAHFERDKGKVTFSANTPDVPLLPGMQDQLSVFVQLGAMLAGAPDKYPSGTNISFETIGPRSAETWVITVGDEENLNLPGGELKAIKLTRKPRREFDQTAELWLAPALGYLPARIKITEKNGDFVDQVWRATERQLL